jgi:hypothetical protein
VVADAAARPRSSASIGQNHGADALGREDLEQEECGLRPSTTWAWGTPSSTARMQASSLGIIPASTRLEQALAPGHRQLGRAGSPVGPRGIDPLDVGEDDELARPQGGRERGRRGVGVDIEHLAVGTSRSGAIVDTTGIRPASRMSRTAVGSTVSTSPTRPMSCSCAVDLHAAATPPKRPASSPERPTASGPCWLSRPDEFATHLAGQHHPHDVHDLGRRDPQAALELAARPRRSSMALICGPPPWTTTGRRPATAGSDVLGERGLEGVVDHRVAAVLDDDEGPAEAFEPGQRLDEGASPWLGDTQGGGVDRAAQSLVWGWQCVIWWLRWSRRSSRGRSRASGRWSRRSRTPTGMQVDDDAHLAPGQVDQRSVLAHSPGPADHRCRSSSRRARAGRRRTASCRRRPGPDPSWGRCRRRRT